MKVVHPCTTALAWSAYPSYTTKSSALQHQPLSLRKEGGSQTPPACKPCPSLIRGAVSTGGWHTRSNHVRESLQAAKRKFRNGDQDGKVRWSTGGRKTALELWHRPADCIRETEKHHASTNVRHGGSWISADAQLKKSAQRKAELASNTSRLGESWGKAECQANWRGQERKCFIISRWNFNLSLPGGVPWHSGHWTPQSCTHHSFFKRKKKQSRHTS